MHPPATRRWHLHILFQTINKTFSLNYNVVCDGFINRFMKLTMNTKNNSPFIGLEHIEQSPFIGLLYFPSLFAILSFIV